MPLRNVLAIAFILILLLATVWFAVVIIATSIPFESVDGLVAEHDLEFHYYGCHQGYSLLLVDNLNRLVLSEEISMSRNGGSSQRNRDLLGKLTITCREEKSVTLHLPSPEGSREITVSGDYTLETWDSVTAKLTINDKSFPVTGDMIIAIDFDQEGPTVHRIDADLSELAVYESDSTSQLEGPTASEIEGYILKSRPILDVLVRKKQQQK
ncbi:MAG TPA: hypothetical protein EYQ08_12220 [Planctomycetes bacterium]|nr:hypothetical protein [Planctomycetota bacterium]HIK83315.1 hypothetical protein [Planctomycetota bacterium]